MANARFIATLVVTSALSLTVPAYAAPIEGQIYDAVSGAPAPGIRLTIVYDQNDFEGGQPVPDTALGAGQQGQVTGADGRYRFDVLGSRFYRLVVDTSATSMSAPSSRFPPRPGLAPLGDVVDTTVPASPNDGSADRSYYLRFEIPDDDDRVGNNHIAVDRVADVVTLDKRADRTEVTTGDIVFYTLTITNRSSRELTTVAGKPIYIVDTPARGLTYIEGRAVVKLSQGATSTTAKVRDDQEDYQRRLIRLGPFDLPAGAAMIVRYAVVVGGDTRPGKYTNRAVVSDSGGVALSNEALAQVEVTGDDALDTGVVLGRVFCDANDNGSFDSGERGAMGARIYIDTGSYAVTDSAGLYHLSDVRGGTRLIKLDVATLAGGTMKDDGARTLRLTEGLSAKEDFPVSCASVDVDGDHPNVSFVVSAGTAKAKPAAPVDDKVVVSGAASSSAIFVGDRTVQLPTASLRLDGDVNFAPVPATGYGEASVRWTPSWTAPDGVGVARWTLTVSAFHADGSSMAPVRTLVGAGALPAEIVWDGLGDDGVAVASDELYAAQLVVIGGDRGAEAASAVVPFGVAFGLMTGAGRAELWAGKLFGGTATNPKSLPALDKKIAALSAALVPGETIDVAVHWDGTGDEIATIARTQTEARLIAALLVAAGVDEAAIKARGRGSLEPIDAAKTAAARATNRRVVVTITPTPSMRAGETIPTEVSGSSTVLVDGEAVAVGKDGSFTIELERDGSALIDIGDANGARSAMQVDATPLPPPPAPRVSAIEIRGDFAANTFAAGDVVLSSLLLGIETSLGSAAPGQTPNVSTAKGALAAPLEFHLVTPAGLAATRWSLSVSDGASNVVYAADGTGAPPPAVEWDGNGADGSPALRAGATYDYELTVDSDLGTGVSPVGKFTVDLAVQGIAGAYMKGTLFGEGSKLGAGLKNHLSKVVQLLGRRPGTERWIVHISTVPTRGSSEADFVLELAARKATVGKYLDRLGLDAERYDLRVSAGKGRDTFDVSVEPPAVDVSDESFVEVAGAWHAVDGDGFSVAMNVGEGEAVTIVVGAATGGQARYVVTPVVRATQPAAPPSKPIIEAAPDPGIEAASASPVAARDLTVRLPPPDTLLASRQLGITGRTRKGNRIFVGGKLPTEVRVAGDGTFAVVVDLPVGRSDLVVQSVDPAGNKAVLTWPVNVDQRYLFAMAMVEGIISTSYTERGFFADTSVLDGMTEDSSVAVGPFMVHGRAVAYVKARVPGGPIASSMEITGHVDTAKVQGAGAFFEDVMNPDRDYPVFGDSGEQVRDVNSRGKLYVRIEAGESTAVIGAIHTDLDEGLVRYDRTVNGAMVDLVKDITASHRVEVKGFASTGGDDLMRDVNWYRATGGSLYYLRHSSVSEGSERVRVVVRDRDNGMVVSERVLERNRDYTVDYVGGRILLIEPMASTASSEWLLDNFDHASAPFDGHPVFVEIRYEHADTSVDTETSGGGHVRYVGDKLSIGYGGVVESRDGGHDYALAGGDMSYTIAGDSTVTASAAYSSATDAANVLSQDGGLTFLDLDQVAAIAGKTSGLALSATVDLEVADLLKKRHAGEYPRLEKLHLKMYAHDVDRGFSAGGAALDQGRKKLGMQLIYQLSDTDVVSLRFDNELSYLPRVGPTRADIDANPDQIALDERAVSRTTLQWGRRSGRWSHRAETGYRSASSTAALADGSAQQDAKRIGAAVGTAYAYNARLTLRAAQRGVVGLTDADPQLNPIDPTDSSRRDGDPLAGLTTNVGADLRLTGDVLVGADWYQRWNGDNAGQVGLTSALSETGSMYVRERVESYEGDVVSTTIIGADDQIAGTAGARTYGEYQIENGALGNRNRAVLGLGHRWQAQRGLRVSLGFEHQQVFGGWLPDGTPVGDNQRNVVYGGVDFTRIERLKAAATIELRIDNSAGTSAIDDVIRDDARDIADPGGFGDHGGVAPGAPLVMAPGERIQVVGGLGANYAIHPDHTALARFRFAHTMVDEGTGIDEYTAARYTQLTAGWAWRPIDHDWFAVLARYSFITDKRPVMSALDGLDSRSHVAALLPIVDLPHDLTLSGKLAVKRTEAISLLDGDETDLTSDALLWLLRLGYRFYGHWDASVELRQLYLEKPEATESLVGTLVEVGYDLGQRVRIGTGYNFSHFSDNELGDLVRDSHGFFVRVTGHY